MREVLLGFITNGPVRAEFMQSMIKLLTADEPPVAKLFDIKSGPILSIARNIVVDGFLTQTDLPWLWMVDTDIEFSERTLPALLEAADPDERPVVSAAVRTEDNGKTLPGSWVWKGPGSAERLLVETDGIARVAGVSASCLLVHRSAFEKMNKHPGFESHWFAEIRQNGTQFREDESFCVRAGRAGIPVHVHGGVEVGHYRTVRVGKVSP